MSRFDGSNIGDAVAVTGVEVTDDGTYLILSHSGGTKLLKVRKSDGQLLITGGVDTDQTL